MKLLETIKEYALEFLGRCPTDREISRAVIEAVRTEPGATLGNVTHLVQFAARRAYRVRLGKDRVRKIIGALIDGGTLHGQAVRYPNTVKLTFLYLAEEAGGGGKGEAEKIEN